MTNALLRFSSLALLVLTACAPAAVPTAAPAAPAVPAEKRSAVQSLKLAQIGLPASMSPEASASNIPLYNAMYDPLIFLDGKNNVTPWAAEKWAQPNPTTWRFTIRKDLTFSNGDKLTAADVEFTINLIVEQKLPQISQINSVTGAKLVDDYAVDILTKVPDASVVPGLNYVWIMPKAYYTAQGKSGFAVKPIGSGPYELVDFRANDVAVFKKRAAEHPFRKVIATDLSVRSITE